MSKVPPTPKSPPYTANVVCPFCQTMVAVHPLQSGNIIGCPQCGGQFRVPVPTAQSGPGMQLPPSSMPYGYRSFVDKKIAAGVCGIIFGGLGVHKFILGLNSAGAIMLTFWVLGFITGMCIVIPIFATLAMNIIGMIEGIIYLSKSDEDFYRSYAIERREWF